MWLAAVMKTLGRLAQNRQEFEASLTKPHSKFQACQATKRDSVSNKRKEKKTRNQLETSHHPHTAQFPAQFNGVLLIPRSQETNPESPA